MVDLVLRVLRFISAHPLGPKVVAHVVGCVVVGVFAHPETGHRNSVQRVHIIVAPGGMRLGMLAGRSRRWPGGGSRTRGRGNGHIRARLAEVDVPRKLRDFALGIEQTGLQVDDVLPQSVVLALQGLVIVRDVLQVLDLFLQFTDIRLLALTERSLLKLVTSHLRPSETEHT